jgi:hypothetical protein
MLEHAGSTPSMPPTPSVHITIVYHSGHGHTARQAGAVARGAALVPGTSSDLLNVAELTDESWAILDRADAIIFGAPTYMGTHPPNSRHLQRRPRRCGPTTCVGRIRSRQALQTHKP